MLNFRREANKAQLLSARIFPAARSHLMEFHSLASKNCLNLPPFLRLGTSPTDLLLSKRIYHFLHYSTFFQHCLQMSLIFTEDNDRKLLCNTVMGFIYRICILFTPTGWVYKNTYTNTCTHAHFFPPNGRVQIIVSAWIGGREVPFEESGSTPKTRTSLHRIIVNSTHLAVEAENHNGTFETSPDAS